MYNSVQWNVLILFRRIYIQYEIIRLDGGAEKLVDIIRWKKLVVIH